MGRILTEARRDFALNVRVRPRHFSYSASYRKSPFIETWAVLLGGVVGPAESLELGIRGVRFLHSWTTMRRRTICSLGRASGV